MAYRNDVDALAARLKDLEDQVGDRTRERDEVATLLAEARARESAERYMAEAPRRRKRQRMIVIAIFAALAIAGGLFAALRTTCGDRPNELAVAIATLERFTDDMCQCPDTACAQKVSDALSTWGQEMSKRFPGKPKELTVAQEKQLNEVAQRLGKCMTEAMTVELSPKPDEPLQAR